MVNESWEMIEQAIENGHLVIRIPLKIGEHQLDIKLAEAIQKLTLTECKVFRNTLQGDHYKEIANKLNCSLSTVKHHLRNIYRKLGVTTRYELQRNYR